MKKLSYNQMVRAWNKSVKNSFRSYKRKPKFSCGQVVIVRTKEPNLGWTWMDDCRLEKKGKCGIVVHISQMYKVPEKYSSFDYRIRFEDGRKIVFVEEHLRKL